MISVSIDKKEPSYSVPQGVTAVYGQTLADISLSDGWEWKNPASNVGEVGNHTFKAVFTPSDANNYNQVEADIPVQVNKKTLIVNVANKEVEYGEAPAQYSATITGFVNEDDISDLGGELTFQCDYTNSSDVGEYTIEASGLWSNNYTIQYTSGTLSVNSKPITVTIDAKESVYGEEIVSLTANDNGGIINGDTNVYSLSTEADSSSNVGNYAITGTGLDDNYTITFVNEDDAYKIIARELNVSVDVADKEYNGTNNATIVSAVLENVANDINISFTDFTLSGDEEILQNYTLKQPTGVTANITNDWMPNEYLVSASNLDQWLNEDVVINPSEGYKISLENMRDAIWSDSLIFSEEDAEKNVVFYLKNEETGAISQGKTVTYKLDKTNPTGSVSFDKKNRWESLMNEITFGLFYKDNVTVKVESADSLSGVAKVEYFESDKVLTLDEINTIENWAAYDENGILVAVEDAKQFVYYVRITDNAGNITYLSTNGAEYDTSAPIITGVENGGTYYVTKQVTVTDKNLETVTVNGEVVTGTISLEGNKDASYTIIATDKGGNTSTVMVTMKSVEPETIDDKKTVSEEKDKNTIKKINKKKTAKTNRNSKDENKSADDSNSPETGDNSNLWLLYAFLFVSGAGIIGILLKEYLKLIKK